jgi:hypothetical protein
MTYDFLEHKHRFAAWCAATASSASPKCRFTVKRGFELLNHIQMDQKVQEQEWKKFRSFDEWHVKCCTELGARADSIGINGFSYGVAAKMINCYIKAFYIGNQEVLSVAHPPIDRLLLSGLAERKSVKMQKIWRDYRNKGWSTFNKEDYLAVIDNLKSIEGSQSNMWKVESYWPGYR